MKNHKMLLIAFLLCPWLVFCAEKDKWIILTTINYPTPAVKELAKLSGWQLLVIGDKKTPKDWYLNEDCIYLSPEDQAALPYKLVKHLPWNHYARKNIGYLYAIDHGAQLIYETDDDNCVIHDIELVSRSQLVTISSERPVVNTYAYFGQPHLWPRGYPLSQVRFSDDFKIMEGCQKQVMIEQGLVNNEPDVDAIFRLTRHDDTPILFNDETRPCVLPPFTFCPFNTQNTLFHKEAFWGLYIPSYVPFRVCDIWRGYIAQRLLWEIEGVLCFTPPSAIQERNPHNLMHDFLDEQLLYLKTEAFIDFLMNWKPHSKVDVLESFQMLYFASAQQGFTDPREKQLVEAWITDIQEILYKKTN